MNILKVVIDGGWIIRESEMSQIIQMVDLTSDLSSMSVVIGSNFKEIKRIARETIEFFK